MTVAFFCLGGVHVGRADPVPRDLRADLEAAARDLSMFDVGEFLYDRETIPRYAPADLKEAHAKAKERVFGPADARRRPVRAEIEPLLAHEDPRVRGLAMCLLFDREEPEVLPLIADRLGDDAPTIPGPIDDPLGRLPIRTEPVTVARYAELMLRMWVERCPVRPAAAKDVPPSRSALLRRSFDAWWALHKDRSWSAGWFSTRLWRAAQGASIARERVGGPVFRVREHIERLPPVARDLNLLMVFHGTPDTSALVKESTLRNAARRLGPERCLAVLRGTPLTDDPDEACFRDRAVGWILDHVEEALRPSDAEAVLALAIATKRHPAAWYAAAARLHPDRADEILTRAFERVPLDGHDSREGARLAWEAWTLVGEPRASFLLDRTFRARGAGRDQFLYRLIDRWKPEDRRLLARYVADPRFDAVGWESMLGLLRRLNENLEPPVVPNAELEGVRHPLGPQHFDREALRKEPTSEETRTVLAALARWRAALRESASRWGGPEETEGK
jgi:hypothetical protein